jgi:hypothetical protein
MINNERYSQALKALQGLIIHSKALAYNSGNSALAELLNDIELLPEFIADECDRTDDFVEMLQGIAQTHPGSRYIVDDFLRGKPARPTTPESAA